MAEVQTPLPPPDGRLVHSSDLGSATPAASGWWSKSSWFMAGPVECPNTRAREELPVAHRTAPASDVSQARPAGGAMAQCRFAGRCAVPIATTAPIDGSPIPLPPPHAPTRPAWQPHGHTCDGATASGDPKSVQQNPSGGILSKWRFDFDSWGWQPVAGAKPSAGTKPSAAHLLTERRWGDGRDELPQAVLKAEAAHNSSTTTKQVQQRNTESQQAQQAQQRKDAAGFAAVGGMWKQKEALRGAVVLPLRHPELFERLGVQALQGVLLHGPPGSGKTFLLPYLAAEAIAHLEVLDGAEVAAGQEAATKLHRAFTRAKSNAPSILFIDSIDALAPARHPGSSSDQQQVSQLLASLLDGLKKTGDQVAVMAAANSCGGICQSLLRPGRLGIEVRFGTPSDAERLEIVHKLTQAMPLAADVAVRRLSERMRGFVPADCAAVVAEAASACVTEAVAQAKMCPPQEAEARLLNMPLQVTLQHFERALSSVSPSCLRQYEASVPSVGWGDIGGYPDVKRALQEMIQLPLKRPELLKRFGAKPARGALLYGPPGCGKTLLAAAAAAECGANFVSVRGPELLDKWLGESERADSLAVCRGGKTSMAGDAAAARILTQLLVEMDGFSPAAQVFVLGATNRPEVLDPAILRPGRLDSLLGVPLPDVEARTAILSAKLRNVPTAPGVNLHRMAALTAGFSGAELAEVCRRACQLAMRTYMEVEGGETEPLAVVTAAHFEDALGCARRVHTASSTSKPADAASSHAAAAAARQFAASQEESSHGGDVEREESSHGDDVHMRDAAGCSSGQQRRQRQLLQTVLQQPYQPGLEADERVVADAAAAAAAAVRKQMSGSGSGGGGGGGATTGDGPVSDSRAVIEQQAAYIAQLEAALHEAGRPLSRTAN